MSTPNKKTTIRTILITGSSTGIGRASVKYFSDKGWLVAATMRHPEQEMEMQHWQGVKLYRLDVTDTVSVKEAINNAINDLGSIHVLCNNAGYGAIGIFEKASEAQARAQFETNVFGCMNTIRAILPHFRQKRGGTIINITSIAGLIAVPIYSLYHGTKWAMEGFSESLAYEVKQFNIKVKCIEPGAIKTDFYSRSQVFFRNEQITEYDAYEQVVQRNIQQKGYKAAGPEIVAKTIYKAATSNNYRLRYAVGGDSPLLLFLRRISPDAWYTRGIRLLLE